MNTIQTSLDHGAETQLGTLDRIKALAKRNRKKVGAIAATAAFGVPSLAGCALPGMGSSHSSETQTQSESPEARAERLQREAFMHNYETALNTPNIQVIADPLQITERAKQREAFLDRSHALGTSDISLYTDPTELRGYIAADKKLAGNSPISAEASLFVDMHLANGCENIQFAVNRSRFDVQDRERLGNCNVMVSAIDDPAVRKLAAGYRNYELAELVADDIVSKKYANAIMPYISDNDLATRAMLSRGNEEQQKKISDDHDKVEAELNRRVVEANNLVFGGGVYTAERTNADLKAYNKARVAQSNEQMPSLLDFVRSATPDVTKYTDVEKKAVAQARGNWAELAKQSPDIATLGNASIDRELMQAAGKVDGNPSSIVTSEDVVELKGDLGNYRAMVLDIQDTKLKALVNTQLDASIARKFGQGQVYDFGKATKEADQVMLNEITDDKIRTIAQAMRGGADDSKLAKIEDAVKTELLAITEKDQHRLDDGANWMAEVINDAARTYLLAQR